MHEWDVIVVGAGAAGLMAAIFAARQEVDGQRPRVLLLDGQAKMAGVVDSKLWNLALNSTLRGGTLPAQKTMRRARVIASRIALRPRVRMARRIRRPARQKQAVILGRGPVHEDRASIILIGD